MKQIGIVLVHLLLTFSLHATDSSIVSFSVGNKYAFWGLRHPMGAFTYDTVAYTETIVADTTIGDRKYFIFNKVGQKPWAYYAGDQAPICFRRADSTAIYQFQVSLGKEDTIANLADTIFTKYNSGFELFTHEPMAVFGRLVSSVSLGNGPWIVRIAPMFFLVYYDYEFLGETRIWLKAAKISGMYYGDTTLVSVAQNSQNVLTSPNPVLFQNYPNPFNPTTQIEFYLHQRAEVSLVIYDLLGRKVTTLQCGMFEQGYHKSKFDGSKLPSGMYFARLSGGVSTQTRKLVLLR
jgi:hypothetical protein